MTRIKTDLPASFAFTCRIPVRITDINYGGHVGNDTVLTLIHEARMQYLHSLGYTELQFAGVGMIMASVSIEFRNELFYGDTVIASVATAATTRIGFDLVYKLEKESDDKRILVATARTGMVCYDYSGKRIASLPAEAMTRLTS